MVYQNVHKLEMIHELPLMMEHTIFCFHEYSSKKQISNVLPMHVLKVASSHNKTMHSNFCSHA